MSPEKWIQKNSTVTCHTERYHHACNTPYALLFAGLVIHCGCSTQPGRNTPQAGGPISQLVQEKVATVASSVVGISVSSEYRIEQYRHDVSGGRPVRDSSSPTGYRLVRGPSGISSTYKNQDVYGAGLVIYQEPARALVLTSRHILVPPDTVTSFCLDEAGNTTDLLFSRSIRTHIVFHVVGASGRWFAADVVRVDSLSDLGLMTLETEGVVGLPFPYNVVYDAKIDWGYPVFAFGYPRGVKQVSFGVTSPSPYPGTFAMDAAARFGYSGGPVFVVRPDGELDLAGVVRGAQVNKLQFVTPPANILPGQLLSREDLNELKAEEYTMIEYGVAYAVNANAIGSFLSASASILDAKGIHLSARFYPGH